MLYYFWTTLKTIVDLLLNKKKIIKFIEIFSFFHFV